MSGCERDKALKSFRPVVGKIRVLFADTVGLVAELELPEGALYFLNSIWK